VLVVDAAAVPGWPPLPWAARETRHVAAQHGAASVAVSGATREAVARGMAWTSVWHFACHGDARLDAPLDSALVLTDGPLTLREILARSPSDRRLAVLSACDTNAPDLDLLDEVVSLPGGLLRAGVAGVVASLWQVRDDAALYLMAQLHQRLGAGDEPAAALAAAQRWLRTVTNGELHRLHPDLLAEPAGFAPDDLAAWRAERRFAHPYYWAGFTFTGA
jgi:CHAT domain-containing protein